MKKLIAILLAASMLFSVTACSTAESEDSIDRVTAEGDTQLILDDFYERRKRIL